VIYSDQEHGLQGENKNLYIQRLRNLGKFVTLWPHVDEQLLFTKSAQVELLDRIANEVTQTHRPRTTALNLETQLIAIQGMVLKREGGEGGNMVLFEGDPDYPQTDFDVRKMCDFARPYKWLAQEYVSYLRRVGEWRVFFCGGREIFTIQTEPRDDSRDVEFALHLTCLPLKRMK
jgi:hypothetical protein